MKNQLREFARKIREHLKTAKHSAELTKQLEKLANDSFAISNMTGWDCSEAEQIAKSLGPSLRPRPDIDPLPLPKKK
jgi:hypothetical protein